MNVRLPHNGWTPRPYQMGLWSYLERGGKRAIQIAHRRWGKDDVFLHWTAVDAMQNVGNIWHMLPEYTQARKAIWTAVNPHTGKRRIDEAFPREIRATTNEQEMFIRFKNGSTWQVIGSDNYKSLVGTVPRGVVISEWAKANPGAWAYLAPILAENGGWAAFITTPEGRNHAHAMLEMARKNPAWHAEVQTVEDTHAISLEVVAEQRAEYVALYGEEAGEALIEQEFYCSFEAAILGAYWGKEMARAEKEGRICSIERLKGYPVHTAWDIGVDDPMAIWVFQVGPGWVHMLDYYESSGHGFDHYVDWLNERGYKGGIDWVPHDAKQREPGAPGGRTRIQTLLTLGRKPQLVPNHKPIDRINAFRRLMPRVYFDGDRCKKGMECLRSYKQEWDEDNRVFRKQPKHDWASHGADAAGHLAVAVEFTQPKTETAPFTKAEFPPITVNDLIKLSGSNDRKWA
jgi:phage terminase large subunit